MITLSIEQSSARGSLALLRGEKVLSERSWEATWRQTQQLFALLPEMLSEALIQPRDIDVFAPGLGPGSFAGCRVAVAAACAFAVPDGRPVFGISSGEALAYDVFAETNAATVVVVGDARRQHVWQGHFARGDLWPIMTQPWALQPMDRLAEVLPGTSVIVSPDWDRLADQLKQACPPGSTLLEASRLPVAGTLGLLAYRKVRSGQLSEPLSPIYLHPAIRPDWKGTK